MFSHVVIGSNNLEASKKFYDAIFAALGVAAGSFDPKGRLVYSKDGQRLLITTPINGKDATHANGGTIGFHVQRPEIADAWHAAGVANGGTSIENPPGVRQNNGSELYLAYLRDPDGNKLCARCAMSA
jgi:catechol 2,3-dioxygenase-like lactoylglutathione lyase family enzyme